MSAAAPEKFMPWQLAEAGLHFSGALPLTRMPRLVELADKAPGDAWVECQGGIDQQGIRFLKGCVRGCIEMICQRCMSPLEVRVESSFALGLIETESQIECLPDEYDPCLAPRDEHCLVATLVEDEFILALPQVARHSENEACPEPEQPASQPADDVSHDTSTNKPFQELAALMRKRSD